MRMWLRLVAVSFLVWACDDDPPAGEDTGGVDVMIDSTGEDTAVADSGQDSQGEDTAVPTDTATPDTAPPDTSPPAVCGNELLETGEECDDGNTASDDGCSSDCALEAGYACPEVGALCEECGNGNLDTRVEECDDGGIAPDDGCSETCTLEEGWSCPQPNAPCELCGDGVVDGGETCDDGNRDGGDGCAADCKTIEAGHVCPTEGAECVAERCGDGEVAGAEGCDDGARLSGDGCSFLCQLEPGWVCDTPGQACREAVCGDGVVEGLETCDDANDVASDGCDACVLQDGFKCDASGCVSITCGDGAVEGLETCDDSNSEPADGCDGCRIQPGFKCPPAGGACEAITCGDGLVEGLETCDDNRNDDGDGCSASCAEEPLYACEGEPSVCKLVIEFVSIARFAAPTPQTQSVHYDPVTRSFVVYGFSSGDGVEFCLDGTVVGSRPRYVGGRLDGATYDPFTDRFLFVQQDNVLTEVDRSGTIVRQETLTGVDFAGGIAVGDNGRLYLSGQRDHKMHIFERFGTAPIAQVDSGTGQTWFDQMISIPGLGLVGAHFRPNDSSEYHVTLWDLDGQRQGRSTIPGLLFRNGSGDFTNSTNSNSDGAEAAVDGGAFLVCSEYDGVCELFARTCETDAECAARVPQTACKLDEAIPYCFAPAAARDDRYSVPSATDANLDVGRNDVSSEAACNATTPSLTGVSTGDQGGTIAIASDGLTVDYRAADGFCDDVETFTYDTDLGGQPGTATVEVFVECRCGDGYIRSNEECDDANTEPNDGCTPTCQVQSGWTCTGEPSVCTPIN